jgi:hypothetical protein
MGEDGLSQLQILSHKRDKQAYLSLFIPEIIEQMLFWSGFPEKSAPCL